jgi:NAD-dependent DNA ligase
VGEHIARVLASHSKTLDDLMSASKEDLQAIDEIGPEVANSLVVFFAEKENRQVIKELGDAGLKLTNPNVAKNERRGFGGYIGGFVVGGVAGAVAGMLTAPQSGEETRRQMRARSIEVRAAAGHNMDKATSRIRLAAADIDSRTEELRTESRVALEEGQKHLAAVADESRRVAEEAIQQIRRAAVEAVEETRKAAIEAAHSEPA